MNYKLIGISGYARSGKDSLFRGIQEYVKSVGYEGEVVRVAFADPLKNDLKDFIQDYYGIDVFTDNTSDKAIIRPLVVGHGEAKRNQNPHHWLEKGLEQVDKNSGNIFVFTDVRYENEAVAIKDHGGIIVRLSKFGNEPANEQEAGAREVLEELSSFNFEVSDFENNQDGVLIDAMVEIAKQLF